MKDLYVHGIVKDYDNSINSLNKYLFSENERLNAIIDELEERIEVADEFCDRYMGVKLELFDMYELLNKIREILGDKEW